ncbi:hypothetical protein GCM10010425_59260 [Streptomyces spororaveus]|uniref:Uncharacterized protein n=1 Tax=Streptomyces spororaveus TaxID=284039 RepID=A0ABQ3T716_9ACTN|nr:hypothetical protein [Streptomyces spororaveus]GHI76203.1 hypothetical protein Sspor_17640 [Streptomyces spororaveus]
MPPRLVVEPPDENNWRRVRWKGAPIGVAHQVSDITVLLTAAGMLDAEDLDLTDPELVEWRGGGPETWAESPL